MLEGEVKKVDVLGVKVHTLRSEALAQKALDYLEGSNQNYIVTVNPEFIISTSLDREFKSILNYADLSIADGNGIIWADYFLNLPIEVPKNISVLKQKVYKRRKARAQLLYTLLLNLLYPKVLKKRIPERLTGADFFITLCGILAKKNYSMYIIGGDKESSVTSRFKLEKMFPDLIISGIKGGFPNEKGGFSRENPPDEELVKAVKKAKPDVLILALGHPYQEKWIFNNLDKLNTVKLAIGIGGALDYISGKKKRAPKIIQKLNLEWLWRFFVEPKRYQRIKDAVYTFPKLVYSHKLDKIFEEENK